jgi:hypothetical protein
VGVAETFVGMGGRDGRGVSRFTSRFPFAGSVARFVAITA